MNTKSIVGLTFLGIGILTILILIGSIISFSNNEIMLRTTFNQKISERTAFYDKMWKTLAQKSQIALKNDSSFKENVNIIMAGRKDAPQVFMKWVTETNPNANFNEVSALYKDLSRATEAQREGFFQEEKVLQDIKAQHNIAISSFPNSLFNKFFGRKPLEYKPITSDITDEVIKTGKDNNVKLF